jgi:hypothetical protein
MARSLEVQISIVRARLEVAQQALEEIAELNYFRSSDMSEHQELAEKALNAMREIQ